MGGGVPVDWIRSCSICVKLVHNINFTNMYRVHLGTGAM